MFAHGQDGQVFAGSACCSGLVGSALETAEFVGRGGQVRDQPAEISPAAADEDIQDTTDWTASSFG
jgi:hypothetical protein